MTEKDGRSRLYGDLAWLWPFWGDASEEYADYCRYVVSLIDEHAQRQVRSLLNIGCGGGKNAFNLKRHYGVVGIDLSPAMLEIAKELNPDCRFLLGDMRSLSLGRTFDAVLIDDAISYMASRADFTAACLVAYEHLNPGGVMVVGPDDTTETFVQNRTVVTRATGAVKPDDLEVVFIENIYDPDPTDEQCEMTLVYLIRKGGKLKVETDRHTLGLFPLGVWQETLTQIGFQIHEQKYAEDDREYVVFACVKEA
jgi:SAM-dependent methyltransferase